MPEIIVADHGKEGGHWYTQSGEPAYTIIGKNGVERATTLRDARKEAPHLVPGVTTILNCAAKPGLESWKQDQLILSCLTLSRTDDEPEATYLSRIRLDAREQARKASETGTRIHAVVQRGFEVGSDDPFYLSAFETLLRECGSERWVCEQSFATDRYGGKCDLHSDKYLIDIKTMDKDLATIKTWEEQAMQLAAYEWGLPGEGPRKCGILYINVKTAESKVVWIPEEKIRQGWNMFRSLLDFWYAKNGLEAV